MCDLYKIVTHGQSCQQGNSQIWVDYIFLWSHQVFIFSKEPEFHNSHHIKKVFWISVAKSYRCTRQCGFLITWPILSVTSLTGIGWALWCVNFINILNGSNITKLRTSFPHNSLMSHIFLKASFPTVQNIYTTVPCWYRYPGLTYNRLGSPSFTLCYQKRFSSCCEGQFFCHYCQCTTSILNMIEKTP